MARHEDADGVSGASQLQQPDVEAARQHLPAEMPMNDHLLSAVQHGPRPFRHRLSVRCRHLDSRWSRLRTANNNNNNDNGRLFIHDNCVFVVVVAAAATTTFAFRYLFNSFSWDHFRPGPIYLSCHRTNSIDVDVQLSTLNINRKKVVCRRKLRTYVLWSTM